MAKFLKVGGVRKRKSGNGENVVLGQTNPKNPQYDINVDIRITDSKGNVLAKKRNPLFILQDPRQAKTKDGEPRRVPDWLTSDVVLVLEDE